MHIYITLYYYVISKSVNDHKDEINNYYIVVKKLDPCYSFE